jgi:hypothetical protein
VGAAASIIVDTHSNGAHDLAVSLAAIKLQLTDRASELAGRLWGAIEGEQAGAPLGGWRRHRQECEARIREAAGPDFDWGCVEGRALPLDTAVSIAFEAAASRDDNAG